MRDERPRRTRTAEPGRLLPALFWIAAFAAALFGRQVLDVIAWMQAHLDGAPGTDPEVAARLEAGMHMIVSIGAVVVAFVVLGAAFKWLARRDAVRRDATDGGS